MRQDDENREKSLRIDGGYFGFGKAVERIKDLIVFVSRRWLPVSFYVSHKRINGHEEKQRDESERGDDGQYHHISLQFAIYVNQGILKDDDRDNRIHEANEV